eukprot:5165352-Pleurochrysis_carterae.AAC.1
MDFLDAAGVHNDTIMLVELRILEIHLAAKSFIDWTSEGAQFRSPTLYNPNSLYHNADKDDVVPTADHVHKRICFQLTFSEKLLMPNACVSPIHTTVLGTPDWWVLSSAPSWKFAPMWESTIWTW